MASNKNTARVYLDRSMVTRLMELHPQHTSPNELISEILNNNIQCAQDAGENTNVPPIKQVENH